MCMFMLYVYYYIIVFILKRSWPTEDRPYIILEVIEYVCFRCSYKFKARCLEFSILLYY